MKVLLEHLEDEKEAQQREMVTTLQRLVLPYLENLGQTKLTERQEAYLESALTNLRDVASRFSAKLTAGEISLTPVELQVADMLKQGKSSKEIADLMSISTTTVAFHRRNIRRKLGLTNQGINLKTYLQSQS